MDADILGAIIEKFIDFIINLSPFPIFDDQFTSSLKEVTALQECKGSNKSISRGDV